MTGLEFEYLQILNGYFHINLLLKLYCLLGKTQYKGNSGLRWPILKKNCSVAATSEPSQRLEIDYDT